MSRMSPRQEIVVWMLMGFFMIVAGWATYVAKSERSKRIELEAELEKYKWKFQVSRSKYVYPAINDTIRFDSTMDSVGTVIIHEDGGYHIEPPLLDTTIIYDSSEVTE